MPLLELSPDAIPPIETVCPPPLGAELRLIPSTLDEIRIEIRPGYSPTDGAQCWAMTAYHEKPGRDSLPASLASSPDCVPLPAAPASASLIVGLVVLALAGRRRRQSPMVSFPSE